MRGRKGRIRNGGVGKEIRKKGRKTKGKIVDGVKQRQKEEEGRDVKEGSREKEKVGR